MAAAAPRAMWKGSVSFGLVSVPVKLFSATESEYGIKFNMLHKGDLSRVNMKTYCSAEQVVIERADTVKGYEFAPDRYVVVTEEELANLPLKTVHNVEIGQFCPKEDPAVARSLRFTKQVYYVEPGDKVGRKAYFLLRDAMLREGVVAVCKVAIRDREAVSVLEPHGDGMMLTTVLWADEVREPGIAVEPGDGVFSEAESAVASQLVNAMRRPFDPSEYKDEYRDALVALVRSKVDGVSEAPAAPEPVSTGPSPVDLVELLKASVAASQPAAAPAPKKSRKEKAS